MRPRNKHQKTIFKLSKKLKPITESQKKYGNSLIESYAFYKYKSIICPICNHRWRSNFDDAVTAEYVNCPNCNAHLKFDNVYSRYSTLSQDKHFDIITTYKGYQIIRTILVRIYTSPKKPPLKIYNEVMQHWITKDGHVESLLRKINTFNWNWASDTNLEFRINGPAKTFALNIGIENVYPRFRYIPELIRNGFKGDFYNMRHLFFIRNILSSPVLETLLKLNKTSFIEYYGINMGFFYSHWKQIKIALRYNYTPNDFSIWKDYINLLMYFNKDIFNPKYLLPKDLIKSHDYLMDKKTKKESELRYEDFKQRIENEQLDYKASKKQYFNKIIQKDDLIIQPLVSVKQFYEIGEQMHFCIFTNEYYKSNNLILKAEINGEIKEIIEFDLSKFKIIQSRGKFNKSSNYHKQILNVVNNQYQKLLS